MTDWERLAKRSETHYLTETVSTTITSYNVFGEKIKEETKTESSLFTWNGKKWVKGEGDV